MAVPHRPRRPGWSWLGVPPSGRCGQCSTEPSIAVAGGRRAPRRTVLSGARPWFGSAASSSKAGQGRRGSGKWWRPEQPPRRRARWACRCAVSRIGEGDAAAVHQAPARVAVDLGPVAVDPEQAVDEDVPAGLLTHLSQRRPAPGLPRARPRHRVTPQVPSSWRRVSNIDSPSSRAAFPADRSNLHDPSFHRFRRGLGAGGVLPTPERCSETLEHVAPTTPSGYCRVVDV
jgi:hypothetical protein